MVDSVTPNEQHDVGTTVKIECKKKFVLFGEEEIICQTDGSWSSIPLCKRLGESSSHSATTFSYRFEVLTSQFHSFL